MKTLIVTVGVLSLGAAGLGARALQDKPLAVTGKELGTIPDSVSGFISSSWDARFIYYTTSTPELRVFDRRSRTTARVLEGAVEGAEVSRKGDRLVLVRKSEDGRSQHVWTVSVDPRTGVANGAPRRASLSAVYPGAATPVVAFSPNGEMIAFVAEDSVPSQSSGRLMIVSASGGPERTLHRGGIAGELQWSNDGRSVFFASFTVSPFEMRFERVAVADAKVTRVVGGQIEFMGLTNRGRHILGGDAEDQVSVWDSGGRKVGSYRVPPTNTFAHYALGTQHVGAITARFDRQGALHAVSFDGSGGRKLIDAKLAPSFPSMSPDGKHISVVAADTANRYVLKVMDADGSNARTIATNLYTAADAYNHEGVWAPNSRFLAYRARGGFFVYDVVGDSSKKLGINDGYAIRWRPDSRSFTFARWQPPYNVRRLAILEATLEGKERIIRDLGTKYSENSGIAPIGDSAILVNFFGTVDAFNGQSRDLLGGFPQAPGSEPNGWRRPTAWALDGSWVASSRRMASANVIEIVPTNGGPTRTITQPFANFGGRRAHPDNKTIVISSVPDGNTPAAIYAVPIDGTAPRKIVTLAKGERVGSFGISPDGRTLLYVSVRQPTTTFVEFTLPLPARKGN